MTDSQVLDFVEEIGNSALPEGKFHDIRWYFDPDYYPRMNLRLIYPMNHETVSRGLHASFCEEVLTTLFSEASNNDACYVTIRVRSAHFESYKDLPQWVVDAPFGSWVVVDAVVNDYLT